MPRRRKSKKSKKSNNMIMKLNKPGLTYKQAKSMSLGKVARTLTPTIYSFVRHIETEQTIESVDFGFTSGSMTFTLQKLVLPGEFTNLFDQYQIVKTETTFQPDCQQIDQLLGSNAVNAFTIPKIYVVRDYDNTGSITEDVAKERQDVIIKQATEKFSVSMVPQVTREIYRGIATTAYEVPFKLVWLDCTYNDVPHYGLRFGITGSQSATNNVKFKYVIRSRYWVRFKNVR